MEFSIVVPIKDEVKYIPRTLPSYYSLRPGEVVLCFDDPPDVEALAITKKVIKTCGAENISKFIFVKHDPEWAYHQANVRRSGFKAARYDRILTVDIDILINRKILKTLELVGKNNVGLSSCSKFYYPVGLSGFFRAVERNVFRKIDSYVDKLLARRSSSATFSGLYAIYRPYWLDSEDSNEVKRLTSVKTKDVSRTQSGTMRPVGEDRFLCDSMIRKHKVIHLPDIAGIDFGPAIHDRPISQFESGRYSFDHGRSLLGAIIQAFTRAHPHFIRGYLYEKLRSTKKMRIIWSVKRGVKS